jgi:hypothetical protein
MHLNIERALVVGIDFGPCRAVPWWFGSLTAPDSGPLSTPTPTPW